VYLGPDDESGDEDAFALVDDPAYIMGKYVAPNGDSDATMENYGLVYFYQEKKKPREKEAMKSGSHRFSA
jgi:hypothetical protein